MLEETRNIPKHLGVIIDGNRRWATERGLPKFVGHKKGLAKMKKRFISSTKVKNHFLF